MIQLHIDNFHTFLCCNFSVCFLHALKNMAFEDSYKINKICRLFRYSIEFVWLSPSFIYPSISLLTCLENMQVVSEKNQ